MIFGEKKEIAFFSILQSLPPCLYSLCKLIRFDFPFCKCFLVNYANLLFILAAFEKLIRFFFLLTERHIVFPEWRWTIM